MCSILEWYISRPHSLIGTQVSIPFRVLCHGLEEKCPSIPALAECLTEMIDSKYLHLPKETENKREGEGGKKRNQNKREICRHRFVDTYTYTYLHVNVWRDVDLYCVPLEPQRMQGSPKRASSDLHERPLNHTKTAMWWFPVCNKNEASEYHPFTCLPCPLKTHPSSVMDWAPSATVHLDRTTEMTAAVWFQKQVSVM